MNKREAGKMGGLATLAKHGKEHFRAIGKLGFNAYVKKHCGGRRKSGARYLCGQGKIRDFIPGTAAELRSIHVRLFPDGLPPDPDF